MAKQTKSKKPENLGKGKVTPIQVAFIVDRYLSDNDFTQTRSTFRAEALPLISKTNIKEAPKSLMSLDEILDEYISLKEQKVLMEQERLQIEQETFRVETLLKGMQGVMDAYNNSSRIVGTPLGSISSSKGVDLVPQSSPNFGTPSGNTTNTNTTPIIKSVSWLTNTPLEPTNFSAASASLPFQNKRKCSRLVSDASTSSKKQCSQATKKTSSSAGIKIPFQAHNTDSGNGRGKQKVSSIQSSSRTNKEVSCHAGESSVRESSVAKNLFQHSSPPVQSSSPSPKTPPQECTSQADNSISPLDNSSVINSTRINTPYDITPSTCAVISCSTKTEMASPSQHSTRYSMERSHYASFSSPAKTHLNRLGTRDHVKGRLDFGASDVSMSSEPAATADMPTSGADENIFNMDVSDFDIFNSDVSLSEFLVNIELECGQDMHPGVDVLSESPHEPGNGNLEATQSFPELSSNITETLSERDMNVQDQDSSASVKTLTKSVTFTSPAKKRSSITDQENLVAKN